MKKILLLFTIISATLFAQPPLTADSVYWSAKYCDTAESIEDCTNSWMFHGNFDDCIQPSEGFCEIIFPGFGLYDSYDCCCKATSLPGVTHALNGFFGGACQEYLDSIGFIYDNPDYINWISLDEHELELHGLYIDIYGRIHIKQPDGLSILNRKKYFKVK